MADVAAASQASASPEKIEANTPFALPELAGQTNAIRDAMLAHADEPSAAKQAVFSNFDLLKNVLSDTPIVFASELHRTSLFRELLDSMERDPAKAVRAYNDACADIPEARIAPLRMNEDEELYELPLWKLSPVSSGAPRAKVYHHDLDVIDRSMLAPRALLVTAMMRLAGCELFVHGTGGAVYDRITERWMQKWLGAQLAPSAAITADVRLPLGGGGGPVTEDAAHKARWRAHSARHNPALTGNDSLQQTKRALVERIAAAKEQGGDTATPFAELQQLLLTHRREHAGAIETLVTDANDLEHRFAESAVASRRDWPAGIYPTEDLRTLRAHIEQLLDEPARSDVETPAISPSTSPR